MACSKASRTFSSRYSIVSEGIDNPPKDPGRCPGVSYRLPQPKSRGAPWAIRAHRPEGPVGVGLTAVDEDEVHPIPVFPGNSLAQVEPTHGTEQSGDAAEFKDDGTAEGAADVVTQPVFPAVGVAEGEV